MKLRNPGRGNDRLRVGVAVTVALAAGANASAQNLPNQSTNRFNYGSRVGQTELPPGATVEPRVDTAVQYADNTDLSSSGGSSAFGIELAPGIYAAYNTPRFVGAVDYSLIGRAWDNGDFENLFSLTVQKPRQEERDSADSSPRLGLRSEKAVIRTRLLPWKSGRTFASVSSSDATSVNGSIFSTAMLAIFRACQWEKIRRRATVSQERNSLKSYRARERPTLPHSGDLDCE